MNKAAKIIHLGNLEIGDAGEFDNLAIILCTYFYTLDDGGSELTESGWSEWVVEQVNNALTQIYECSNE